MTAKVPQLSKPLQDIPLIPFPELLEAIDDLTSLQELILKVRKGEEYSDTQYLRILTIQKRAFFDRLSKYLKKEDPNIRFRDLIDEISNLFLAKNKAKVSRKDLKQWESDLLKGSTTQAKVDELFADLRPLAVLQNEFIDRVRDYPDQVNKENLRSFQIEYKNAMRDGRSILKRIFKRLPDDLNMQAIFQGVTKKTAQAEQMKLNEKRKIEKKN